MPGLRIMLKNCSLSLELGTTEMALCCSKRTHGLFVSKIYLFISLCECFPQGYICVPCVYSGIGSPRTVVTGGSEMPRGCWDSNSGPLEEQFTTEPSPRGYSLVLCGSAWVLIS